jgi:hypothetical protein
MSLRASGLPPDRSRGHPASTSLTCWLMKADNEDNGKALKSLGLAK